MSGRPSHYLCDRQTIAAKVGVGDDLVRYQFLQALPPSVTPVLATSKTLTLEQLGNRSDKLTPLFSNQALNVNKSTKPKQSFYQNPKQQNYKSIGLSPFSADQHPKICRGHIYFAEKSRTCKPWCRWPNKKGCSMQANSRASSSEPSSKQEN